MVTPVEFALLELSEVHVAFEPRQHACRPHGGYCPTSTAARAIAAAHRAPPSCCPASSRSTPARIDERARDQLAAHAPLPRAPASRPRLHPASHRKRMFSRGTRCGAQATSTRPPRACSALRRARRTCPATRVTQSLHAECTRGAYVVFDRRRYAHSALLGITCRNAVVCARVGVAGEGSTGCDTRTFIL